MDLQRGSIRPADSAPGAEKLGPRQVVFRLPSHPPQAFNLRMPVSLKLRLAAAAQENGRSLNQEIVQRLLRSLEPTYRR